MSVCVAVSTGCCAQVATSGKLEDQEVGDMVNGIDPLWVLVDRVISQQEKKGERDWHSTNIKGMPCTLHESDMWRALLQLALKGRETVPLVVCIVPPHDMISNMLPAVMLLRVDCCNSAACCTEHALCPIQNHTVRRQTVR